MTKEQNPYMARLLDFTPPNVTKEGYGEMATNCRTFAKFTSLSSFGSGESGLESRELEVRSGIHL
jgi:hypothetical protein